jgi:Inner membrane component domain
MRLLLNIIWFVLAGLRMAIASAIAALICFSMTIPFGVAWLRIGIVALWSFGKTVVKRADAGIASGIGTVNRRRLGFVGYDLAVSAEGRVVTLEEGWWFVGARRPPLVTVVEKGWIPGPASCGPCDEAPADQAAPTWAALYLGATPVPGGVHNRLPPIGGPNACAQRVTLFGPVGVAGHWTARSTPSATRSTTAPTPRGGLVLGVPYLTNAAVSEFSDMFSTLARLALSFVSTRAARQANQVPHGGTP